MLVTSHKTTRRNYPVDHNLQLSLYFLPRSKFHASEVCPVIDYIMKFIETSLYIITITSNLDNN
jgi:hypothetical protein